MRRLVRPAIVVPRPSRAPLPLLALPTTRLTLPPPSPPSPLPRLQCYKYEDVPGPEKDATVYVSFGGLLMALRGSTRHLAELVVGENVYCLIRK